MENRGDNKAVGTRAYKLRALPRHLSRGIYNPSYMIPTYLAGNDDVAGAKNIIPGRSIGIDLNILMPIITLNREGYRTQWSCHGNHRNKTGLAYILFEPGISLPPSFLDMIEEAGLHHCQVPNVTILPSGEYREIPGETRLRISSVDRSRKYGPSDEKFLREKNATFCDMLSQTLGNTAGFRPFSYPRKVLLLGTYLDE